MGSIGSPGIHSQDASHLLEIFAPFPSVVSDSLRRLPSYDATHLSGSLDVSTGYSWIIMSDVNFKSQRKLLLWNYQHGGSTVHGTRTRAGASNEVFQFSMPGAVGEHVPNANLVAMTEPCDSKSTAGIIAISTYGQIRYWPRISESHRSTDASISLSPDETCATLRSIPSHGIFVLGTSNGRLILISLQGSHSVLHREIRASRSVLRTVGSWLGLGASARPAIAEADDQIVGLRTTAHSTSALLWLLRPSGLHVWCIALNGAETLLLDTNLVQSFESALYEEQEQSFGGRVVLDLTICDFQVQFPLDPLQPGLLTLLIGSIPSDEQDPSTPAHVFAKRGQEMEYHLARYQVHISTSLSATGLVTISSVKTTLVATTLLPEALSASQDYPSLTVTPSNFTAYVHWQQYAVSAPYSESGDFQSDIVDVIRNPGHRIFGSCGTLEAALYFSPSHGIVKLQLLDQDTGMDDEEKEERKVPKVKNVGFQPSMNETMDSGVKSKSKAGYMSQAGANDILSEAFHRYMTQSSSQHLSSPSLSYPWTSLVESLWKFDYEAATRHFSSQIVDSKPSEDPRWPELAGKPPLAISSSSESSYSKTSLADHHYSGQLQALLYRQIEEKFDVHMNFVRFLVEVGIWDELSLSTKDFLEQSSERLAAVAHLRAKHNEILSLQQNHHSASSAGYGAASSPFSIFQQAIESALIAKGLTRAQWERLGLGAQDLFYAQVSSVETILEPTLAILKQQLASQLTQEAQLALITQANFIFQSLFAAPVAHRTQYAREFYQRSVSEGESEASRSSEFKRAYLASSDASIGPAWTRERHAFLREMIRISRQFADQAMQTKAATASRALGRGFASSPLDFDLTTLNDQLYHMTDSLLSDWYQEIIRCEGMDPQHENEMKDTFSALRRELISPFKTDPSQHERALQLAEKYHEFLVIIEICQLQEDDKRLWSFAEQFVQQDFDFVVFEYFYIHKQYYKLMTPPKAHWKNLLLYLEKTPGAQKLSWQQMVRTHDFNAAEKTFDALALQETQSAFNQTTLLSLAKLSQLAIPSSKSNESLIGSPLAMPNEEREERLYLRNAQLAIRALFDHTDEDAVPASSPSLVARLLEVAHGNESVEPGYPLQLAMDLYRHTTLLRTDQGNQDLLESIWMRILELEHWPDLANALQRGAIDDQTLQENVEGSLFFNVALHTENLEQELPLSIFTHCVSTLYNDRATLRVLANAFELVYRSKGSSCPDMSHLIGSNQILLESDPQSVIEPALSESTDPPSDSFDAAADEIDQVPEPLLPASSSNIHHYHHNDQVEMIISDNEDE
jgi:hypothetical protein